MSEKVEESVMKDNKTDLSESFPLSHEACEVFWEYWRENGETHKHGFYESTWGAIRAYLKKAEVTENVRSPGRVHNGLVE